MLGIALGPVIAFSALASPPSSHSPDFEEETIEFESTDGWALVGTLTVPASVDDGEVPAVILCHMIQRNRESYRVLAAELAERGVASLRIDLRAHGDSTNLGSFRDQKWTGAGPWGEGAPEIFPWNSWADVVAARDALLERPEIDFDRIGFVGASYSNAVLILAGREDGFGAAYAFLSAGGYPDHWVRDLESVKASWWAIAARDDRPNEARAVERLREQELTCRTTILDTGGHGTDLLRHRELVEDLALWFAEELAADR